MKPRDTASRERSGEAVGDRPAGAHGRGTLSIDKRKALLAAGLAAVLAAGAFTAVGQAAQFGRLGGVLSRADKAWLPVCLLGQLLAYLGYMLAYRDVARASGGPRFDLPTTARIVVFGTGASVLGASVGGLAVDFWALSRTGTKTHVATRRVLAVGTIEWTVLSVYACGAALLVLVTGAPAPAAMALAWLGAVPACVLGALWFTSPRRVQRFVDPQPSRTAPTAGHLARAVAGIRDKAWLALDDAIAGVLLVRHLLAHPVRYRGGAIGYPIYWAGDMLTLYAAVRAFGGPVNLIALVLAYATSYVISALPLPLGGVGGIEAAMALALHAVRIPLAPALLAVFVYRIVTFWLPVIPAMLLLPSLRRLNQTLPSVPHTPPDADEAISFRPRDEIEGQGRGQDGPQAPAPESRRSGG